MVGGTRPQVPARASVTPGRDFIERPRASRPGSAWAFKARLGPAHGLRPGLGKHYPPQTVDSPSSTTKCLTFAEGSALVSVSAIMSSVGQYMR
jgi:hypothetical protein